MKLLQIMTAKNFRKDWQNLQAELQESMLVQQLKQK